MPYLDIHLMKNNNTVTNLPLVIFKESWMIRVLESTILGDHLPVLEQIDLKVFLVTIRWECRRMGRLKDQSECFAHSQFSSKHSISYT